MRLCFSCFFSQIASTLIVCTAVVILDAEMISFSTNFENIGWCVKAQVIRRQTLNKCYTESDWHKIDEGDLW